MRGGSGSGRQGWIGAVLWRRTQQGSVMDSILTGRSGEGQITPSHFFAFSFAVPLSSLPLLEKWAWACEVVDQSVSAPMDLKLCAERIEASGC